MKRNTLILSLAFGISGFLSVSHSQVYFMPASGDWDSGDWSSTDDGLNPRGKPTGSEDARFGDVNNTQVLNVSTVETVDLFNFGQGGGTLYTLNVNSGGSLTAGSSSEVGRGGTDFVFGISSGGALTVNALFTIGGGPNTTTVNHSGDLTANNIRLADNSGSTLNYNLSGGSLSTNNLDARAGTISLNWTGGTLSANTTDLTALDNTGSGVLSAGAGGGFEMTANNSTYTQGATADLAVTIAGLANFDLFQLSGTNSSAVLDGEILVTLDSFTPTIGDTFDIFTTTGGITDNGISVVGDGNWSKSIEGGNTLRLTAIPEASHGGVFLILGVGAFCAFRRTRK